MPGDKPRDGLAKASLSSVKGGYAALIRLTAFFIIPFEDGIEMRMPFVHARGADPANFLVG